MVGPFRGAVLVTRQRFLATTTMWACLGPHAHGYHWSAANEAVRRGSIFGHLHWANDAFHSGNAGRMCLQRCQRALVIKVGIATTTLYQLWKKIRGESLQDFDKSKTSTNVGVIREDDRSRGVSVRSARALPRARVDRKSVV